MYLTENTIPNTADDFQKSPGAVAQSVEHPSKIPKSGATLLTWVCNTQRHRSQGKILKIPNAPSGDSSGFENIIKNVLQRRTNSIQLFKP